MPHTFAKIMFSEPAKELQKRHGSRAQYERMALSGSREQELGPHERGFIAARDSFYMATVTPDGWPYIQHRGGPVGFLHVLDAHRVAFADYAGNKQYISTGNLSENNRVSLFLMDYPQQGRLKLIGHAAVLEPGEDPALEAQLSPVDAGARIERIFVISIAGFDWNCSQHITPRYTAEEIAEYFPGLRNSGSGRDPV